MTREAVKILDRSGSGSSTPSAEDESSPFVRLDSITHEYGSSTGRFGSGTDREPTALRDVSLDVEPGTVVGVKGPSGSGKSTILHAVAGLLVPTAGTVEVLGTDLTELSDAERVRLRREHVGIVFQRFHLLPSLSARANVALPLVQAGVGRSKRRRRAEELLEGVGLGDRTTHLPGELSGGERQRVAIARALVTDPDVIVADEPTGELDTATGAAVLRVLTALGDDRAVLVASHDDATLSIADRVVALRDGAVVDDGR
ncbi:putative ABC transport system ATP-binding protein [Natronoarchaeum philippinense]|uniref:Putative ABC transport system ATP-binding protein n=1 Tax=Natronoarchaeum philippinense TaxID=558529 RepID=A0A285N5V7_NATPI|nr:ABC transporter ATP-binding protein [Natronoarchaeum philippinense]SNZ04865.1 putative ABC transport system ATP-binding protein [Natronoarchaeum philippinense]